MEENKKKDFRIIIPQKLIYYQKQDKELQEEQNKILVINTNLAWIATIFGVVGALAQVFQIIVDIILLKK